MVEQDKSRSQVGKAIAKGAVWTVSIQMINRCIGLVSTVLLARLLTPSDFGVYALAMAVYGLIELLGAFGFGVALIQNQNATDEHYNTAWTLNFTFSLLCAIALFVGAPWAAELLDEPQLTTVLRFTCLLFLLDACKNIALIDFQKYMTFDKEFHFRILVKLSGFLITVPLAFLLKSYWAMLWGLLASSAVQILLSYRMLSYRPKFSVVMWRDMLGFSSWLQLNNLLGYLLRNIETFLVTKFLGVVPLGSLTMAKETGQLLFQVSGPINRAAFPGYAKVNDNPQKMSDLFCDVMGSLMLICVPFAVGLTVTAEMLVPIILGQKWVHIVPLIELLSLITLLAVMANSANRILIARGKVRWATNIMGLRLFLLVAFMLFLLPRYELIGVIYAKLAAIFIVLAVAYFAVRKSIGLELKRVIYLMYKPVVASAIMAALVTYLFSGPLPVTSITMNVMQLFAAITVGACTYVTVLLMLWFFESRPAGPELSVLNVLQSKTGLVGLLIPENRHA